MKRQKYISLLLAFACLLGLLSACQSAEPGDDPPILPDEPPTSDAEVPEAPADTAPVVSPLPTGAGIDWNDIPDVWIGTGGTEASTWLTRRTYTAAACLQVEDTWENTREGIRNLTLTTPHLAGLQNTDLEDRVNAWLLDATAQLQVIDDPMDKYLTDEVLACPTADLYTNISPSHFIAGNLLSLSVLRSDMLYAYDEEQQMLLESRMATSALYAVFDMRTGEQITLSDLFVDGTDLNALLNPMITSALAASEGETDWSTFRPYGGLIRPFRGLPYDYPFFAVSDEYLILSFPSNTPYLKESYSVYLPLEQLQPYLVQPMVDCTPFVTDVVETFENFRSTPCVQNTAENQDLLYLYGNEMLGVRPYLLTDKLDRPVVDRINAQAAAFYEQLADADPPFFILEAQDDPESYLYGSSVLMANRAFVQLQLSAYVGTAGESPIYRTLARMYDAETGDAVPLSAVLKDTDGALAELAAQGLTIEDPSAHYGWYCYGPNGEIYVCADNGMSPTYTLPDGYFDLSMLE